MKTIVETTIDKSLREISFPDSTYKDFGYVEEQCRQLAQQAKEAA